MTATRLTATPLGPQAPEALDAVRLGPASVGAYQWWYFDALSEDGRFGAVAIFFLGGVFSPLYADRLAAGVPASPLDHPMVNLVVYESGRRRAWAFSEYPRSALEIRDPDLDLTIGRSSLRRDARGAWRLGIIDDDFAARRPLDARLAFTPLEPALGAPDLRLSAGGTHLWGAPGPRCRVTFRSESLGLAFSGLGYHDVNTGSELLHTTWRDWAWGRAHLRDETRIWYDATELTGARTTLLLSSRGGHQRALAAASTPRRAGWSAWLLRPTALPDAASADEGVSIQGERTLESAPFYYRRLASFTRGAERVRGITEYVDLTRYARPSVRFLLRHRTYRRPAPGAAPLPPRLDRHRIFPDDPR